MDNLTILGLLAGFITTSGLVPQVIKGYRSGSMDDVSLLMPLVLMAGMALWLAYGVLLGDLPIIFWNGVGVSLNAILIALKIRSDQKKKGAEPQIIR
jgi:MtN3 and saliva related transmembrane protein